MTPASPEVALDTSPSAPAASVKPRVLVLQLGARLHYAVPAVYARAGALESLYTDACASLGVLSLARRTIPAGVRTAALHRLLARTLPPEVTPERVRVDTWGTLTHRVLPHLRGMRARRPGPAQRLRARILRERFEGANCLYCLSNGDLELMTAAREEGLAVIYEQITPPTIGRTLREERRRFPGIEPQQSAEEVERGIARDARAFRIADAVLCASEHVRQGVMAIGGSTVRSVVLPYGIHPDWLQVPRAPVRGRILFVGNVGLGKGVHYLAEATRILRARGVACDVRVVGAYDPQVISRPEFQGPTYVGQVARDRVRAEYAQADVLAIPTLADAFAIVHLEAFACGVPVVTTANCGSQVRDGENGFVVPVRDARALAERLEQLISDRALRARMSEAATARARELSWDQFGEQLMVTTGRALARASTVAKAS